MRRDRVKSVAAKRGLDLAMLIPVLGYCLVLITPVVDMVIEAVRISGLRMALLFVDLKSLKSKGGGYASIFDRGLHH